jgi:tape measure domain-containing protein
MSGSRQPVGIRISAEGADKARRELEQLGTTGDAALRRIGTASAISEPQMQKLAQASDVANRAFVGMGGTLGRVGATFTGVTGVAGGMTAGFLALAAAAGVGAVQIAKVGDAATATLARLTSSTGGLQAAQTAYEGLYRLSQQTGVSVAESAGAFSRFAVAAKEIGGTNDQVLKLVGGLQKAALAIGANAQESGAAVQQLGQALASGTLQGDELKSVIENMAPFAARLAKELGVSLGQLKAMGAEGKLTADVVFPAMLRAAEGMSAEFDKMPRTMGQAAGILGEASANFLAQLDRITGLSEKFRDAMLAGARALDSAASFVSPSDRDRAQAGVTASQSRLSQLRSQLAVGADVRTAGVGQLASPADRTFDTSTIQAQIAAEEERLKQHQAMLRLIENDGRRQRGEEAADAEVQRQTAARTRSATEVRDVLESNNKRLELARKFNDDFAKIARAEQSGALTASQAEQARADRLDDYREGLEKVEKANEKVTAATTKRTEAEREAESAAKKAAKEQETALDRVRKATEKAADEQRRYQERSFDAVVNIAESAMERVGSAITDAFVSGNGAAVNFGNIIRGVLGSVVTDFAKLAVINPILNSLFTSSTGARPTLAASGIGGIGDLLGLGSSAGKLLGFDVSSIFGGAGGSLSGALAGANSYLFGSAGVAPMAGASFAEGVGATSGLLGSGGAFSLGGIAGGAGLGFGVGSLTSGLLGGNQLGGGIGGAIGGALGSFAGPLGTILGSAIGGGLGGLVGNSKPSSRAFSYALTGQGTQIGLTQEYYNAQGDAAFQEARTNNAAVNKYLQERGLQVSGIRAVGGNRFGMGNLNLGEAASYNEAFQSLRFTGGSNADLNRGLTDRSFADPGALQAFVDGLIQTQDVLKSLAADPIPAFTAQMTALNDNFDKALVKVREYGLAEDALTAARAKQVAAIEAQRTETLRQSDLALDVRLLAAQGNTQQAELIRQMEAARQETKTFGDQLDALAISAEDKARRLVDLEEVQAAERAQIIARYGEQAAAALRQSGQSIRQYVDSLRASPASGASPYDQFQAANANFVRDAQLARGGDKDALGRITSASDTLLNSARGYYGSSDGFQQTLDRVLFNLEGLPAVRGYDALQLAELEKITAALTAGGDAAAAAAITAQTAATTQALTAINNVTAAGNSILSQIHATAATGNQFLAVLNSFAAAANDYAAAANDYHSANSGYASAANEYLAAANTYAAAGNDYLAAANQIGNAGNTILGDFSNANTAGITASNRIAFDVGNSTVAALNASNTIAATGSQAVVAAVNSVATQIAALVQRVDALDFAVRNAGVTVASETREGLNRTVDELTQANTTLRRLVA